MENKLLIRTEMFGYSKSDTEDYILKLQTEFDRKLSEAKSSFRTSTEQLESSYYQAEEEKLKLEKEKKQLEDRIRQLSEEYERTIAEIKRENENLAEAMEVLLSSCESSESQTAEATGQTDSIAEPEALPPAEFSRIFSAIQMSDESLIGESQSTEPDNVSKRTVIVNSDPQKIKKSLDVLSDSLSSFTKETLNAISRIKDSVH
ncbi:MAG: hypothetical protein Q4F31_05995 [Eubacteriales bacterium]|nr:hypothetical protein [Eubacteriales bacterium]